MEIISTDGQEIGAVAHRKDEDVFQHDCEITIDEFKEAGLRTKDGIVQCNGVDMLINNQSINTVIVLNSKVS